MQPHTLSSEPHVPSDLMPAGDGIMKPPPIVFTAGFALPLSAAGGGIAMVAGEDLVTVAAVGFLGVAAVPTSGMSS